MEKVKVVKAIPGILKIGDVLVSPVAGADFTLEETEIRQNSSSERYASLDYVTVSENIPNFFEFDVEEDLDFDEDDFEFLDLEDGTVFTANDEEYTFYNGVAYPCGKGNWRSAELVEQRYKFFKSKFENASNEEELVVYKNLMWFIEWLRGDAELV